MIEGLRRLLRVPRSPREQAQREVEDEIGFHLEMRTEELVQEGLDRAAARQQAEREFGDLERGRAALRTGVAARARDARRTLYFDELKQDLRYALRSVRERPGFSLVVILTLTLGIVATTTIYTAFQGLIVRALPVFEPERVVIPKSYERGRENTWTVTYADFADWRERGVFDAVAVMQLTNVDMRLSTEPERLDVALVSMDFFRALGARAQLGRTLGPADFAPDAPRAIVISHEVWQTRLAGAPDVLGRRVGSTRPGVIVGVLERGAAWPRQAELWVPLLTGQPGQGVPQDWLDRDNYVFSSVARLRAGATLEQTSAQLDGMARVIEQQFPAQRARISITAIPLRQELLGEGLPRVLWILLAAVGAVLLIGCANIANLLLVRGAARRREFAVRLALGARPGRLARQLLTESLMFGITGGVLGLVLSRWAVDLLLHFAPSDVPLLHEIRLDRTVLLVGLGASMGAALLFGLAPMLQALRVGAAETIADTTARTAGGRHAARLRRSLVVAELALSVLLLVGAGLLIRSLMRLQRTDPGFRTENLITLSLRLTPLRYPNNAAEAAFFTRVVDRLRAVPGVRAVAVSSALPLGGGGFYLGRAFLAEGRPDPPAGQEVWGPWNVVGPGYFGTMGMNMVRGREFTERDDSASAPVIIVNQAFVDQMFPAENPLGKRVRSWRDENLLREIVGVVPNVRYFAAGDEIRPLVYVPHGQNIWSTMSVMVRTDQPEATMTPIIRRAITTLDRDLAVAELSTMEQARRTSLARPRFNTLLLTVFAALALLLATLGIYGVLAYGVSQRTREIGVRIALGAHRSNVIGLILKEAVLLVGGGVALGLAAALAATRLMTRLLYELDARDPLTFGGVALLLVAIALLASYLPARRAARVQPVTALRTE
ncbi:MAG: ADOP family duplicated permease [Longimicrobiales bacterium]